MSEERTFSLVHSVWRLIRLTAVYGVLGALVILMTANWALPYFSVLKPNLLLIIVFYWSIYRPSLLPPWMVFTAGIFTDALNPVMPLGVQAASLLLISAFMRRRRRILLSHPFTITWFMCAIVVFFDMIWKYGVLVLLTPMDIDPAVVFLNGFITVMAFPLLALILAPLHRVLPHARGLLVG